MIGDIIIGWPDGWACSNESYSETQKEFSRDEKGNILPVPATKVTVFIVKDMYTVEGELKPGTKVQCVFRLQDTGDKIGFIGEVERTIDSMTAISMKGKINEDVNNLLIKIKTSWQV